GCGVYAAWRGWTTALAASTRDDTPSLLRMLRRWVSTVLVLRNSDSAIWRLVRRSNTSSATSSSRPVSDARPNASVPGALRRCVVLIGLLAEPSCGRQGPVVVTDGQAASGQQLQEMRPPAPGEQWDLFTPDAVEQQFQRRVRITRFQQRLCVDCPGEGGDHPVVDRTCQLETLHAHAER